MRKLSWFLVAAFALAFLESPFLLDAQSPKEAENALKARLMGKQELIRGFSADNVAQWTWNGNVLVETPPALHTLAILIIDSVKVKGTTVEIGGVRHTVLRTSPTTIGMAPAADRMKIVVDFRGADPASLLPTLAEELFYRDLRSARADLPFVYRDALPAAMNNKCCEPPAKVNLEECDCADCGKDFPKPGMAGLSRPRVIHTADPQLTDQARTAKFSGGVEVGISVDPSGRPHDFWIARPAGLGLDFEAYRAVKQYLFKPTTCHGTPIDISLSVDVSFASY